MGSVSESHSVHGILQARVLESFPSPGDLPNPGVELRSPALPADSLSAKLAGKHLLSAKHCMMVSFYVSPWLGT